MGTIGTQRRGIVGVLLSLFLDRGGLIGCVLPHFNGMAIERWGGVYSDLYAIYRCRRGHLLSMISLFKRIR